MGKYSSMSGGYMSWHLPPDAEYSHPSEEGPLLLAGRWLYTLIVPIKMNTRTRGKPKLHDSQGMTTCPQMGGVDHKGCPALKHGL